MAIPKNKEWKGVFRGNHNGNLWQTHNIDLERNPGRLALANRLRRFDTTGIIFKWLLSDADTTLKWWAIDLNNLMKTSNHSITGAYANDALSNTPTDPKDMIIHESLNGEDRLVVTRDTDIAILNSAAGANTWLADWWTNGSYLNQTALSSGVFHPLGKLQRLVAVGDVVSLTGAQRGVLHTIDKDDVVSNSRIVFRMGLSPRIILNTSDRFWIGLAEDRGLSATTNKGQAWVVEWDGTSSTYNKEYPLPGVAALTGFVVNDVPYFITDTGAIMKFSGGAFVKVQEFPMFDEQTRFSPIIRTDDQESGIDPYGVFVDENERVYINIAAPYRTPSLSNLTLGVRRMRSGVWIFNTLNNNLYHHMGLSEYTSVGTDISYGGVMGIPGGIIKSEDGDFNRVVITSARMLTGGATWDTGNQDGVFYEERTTNRTSNTGRNRGYFITTYITQEEAEAMWTGLWAKFKRLISSDDKIIVKWRVLDPMRDQDDSNNSALQCEGTWVNTTSFTGPIPTGVAIGDEVEILSGDNAGCSFNISNLSATPDGSTTVTVTIDEASPTSSTDKSLVRFDNWRSEPAITATNIGNKRVPFTKSTTSNAGNTQGEFIQLKIELRGFDINIDELEPLLKTKTSFKQA